MKKVISSVLCIALAMLCLCSCGKAVKTDSKSQTPTTTTQAVAGIGTHHVEITVKDYGVIKLELDGDSAPITVQNFLDLINSGFYDGLTFHRIMSNFMIQGGDPKGDGTGGSENEIKGEFSQNGVSYNKIHHKRGVISMARASYSMDSASSQFFICNATNASVTNLDGAYAAFGYVTEGMDVVDKITENANPTDDNGTIPSGEQPVIETIKVID